MRASKPKSPDKADYITRLNASRVLMDFMREQGVTNPNLSVAEVDRRLRGEATIRYRKPKAKR